MTGVFDQVTERPNPTAASVAGVLRSLATILHHATEDRLQFDIAFALSGAFPSERVEREVILEGDLGRIDVVVGRVGIEVKIAGRPEDVSEQLRRYARSERLDELVLVTTRIDHGSGAGKVDGKPAQIVNLVGARL